MCFGVLMLVDVWEFFARNWIYGCFVEPRFLFSFVPGLHPWPGYGMYIHFAVMALLSVLVGAGLFYRAAAVLLFFANTYVFLLDKSLYLNHMYLVCLLSFLLAIMPANSAWSLDARRMRLAGTVPRWCLLILKFQFFLVYFYGGIAKLNSDWLRGEPQTTWMMENANDPLLGRFFAQPSFAWVITYGGIGVDLLVGFLLAFRRTFWFAAIIAASFHLINSRLFDIGIFPWLMMASIGLFACEDWPGRVIQSVYLGKDVAAQPVPEPAPAPGGGNGIIQAQLIFILCFAVVQVLIPLRRFLYQGNASWTEQGHRFSWAMKLREKRLQSFDLLVTDPKSGQSVRIDAEHVLAPHQFSMMNSRPDMILQFAHHVADEFEKDSGTRPVVRVKSVVSMNNRPPQDLIDPSVDLAAVKDSLMPAPWIVPLKE
jgi:hypothetical protein